MATIFQKTATDECLILEPREAFYYPFNIGNYGEARLGMYLSITSISGNNTLYGGNENILGGSAFSSMYIGFAKTGDNIYNVPSQTGVVYCGLYNPANALSSITSNAILFDNIQSGATVLVSDFTGAYIINSGLNISGVEIPLSIPTGSTGYANFFGISLSLLSNNTYIFKTAFNPQAGTGINISGLRSELNTFSNSQIIGTGLFTTGFTNNINIIDKPNSVFLYFPFLNSKVRIHSLIVERFA